MDSTAYAACQLSKFHYNNEAVTPPEEAAFILVAKYRKATPKELFVSPSKTMSISKGVISANTKPSTQWRVQLFKTLLEQRSIRMGEGPESATPPDILRSHDVDPVYRDICSKLKESTEKNAGAEAWVVQYRALWSSRTASIEKLVCTLIQHWRCLLFASTKYSYLYALTSIMSRLLLQECWCNCG